MTVLYHWPVDHASSLHLPWLCQKTACVVLDDKRFFYLLQSIKLSHFFLTNLFRHTLLSIISLLRVWGLEL